MSQIVTVESLTEERRAELKELCDKATQVVGWYAHNKEVRGPFCRWFTCSEVNPEYQKHVAYTWDDCAFAAAAMNSLPVLLELLNQKDAKIKELKADMVKFLESTPRKWKFILMLQWAHAVEVGAYEAYEGHWRSLPDGTTGQRTIKAIQIDELNHKEALEQILRGMNAKPSKLMDAFVWTIGKTISVSCRFMGHRNAMWGAKVMEVMGANLYKKIAKLARDEGYPALAVELDWMQSAEEDHERYIRICLEPSRESVQQNRN